jgi:hypothetical protein
MVRCCYDGGTGTIQIANSGNFGLTAITCWAITGLTSNTPTGTANYNGFSTTQSDPQGPMSSLTVPSSGIGIVAMGANFKAATVLPFSWTPNPAVIRDATTEVENATGNMIVVGGAHITVAGTYTGACGSGGICSSGATSMGYAGMVGSAWH